MRLGVDVGGTNTDAVILDEKDDVVSWTKTPTTDDVTEGIKKAMKSVVSEVEKDRITHVMVGTTHCTNAIAERKNLAETAVLRIGAPATLAIKPLFEWPEDLRKAIGNHTIIVEGGHEFDGEEIKNLDEEAIRTFLTELKDEIESVSITSVFSPVNPEHEERAQEIAGEILKDSPISVSNEIGSIGLLERENATALNAALVPVIERTSKSITDAINDLGLNAGIYFCQNDGTLMDLDYARNYPVLTLASGPSNSVKGAAFLSEIKDGIVVDVGGTTTDIGALKNGFPRESSSAVEIGGIKTNFRMPDLISVAIGGGSIVKKDGKIRVGPESVGKDLPNKSLSFNGTTFTATDAAVRLGLADIGEKSPDISKEDAKEALTKAEEEIQEGVEKMKTERSKVPVALVGGGSILVRHVEEASTVDKPEHYEVANAVGAAISQVSGEVDKVFSLENKTREEVIEEAEKRAIYKAKKAGADPKTIETVNLEEIPLAYLPGNAVRIKLKVAGNLKIK